MTLVDEERGGITQPRLPTEAGSKEQTFLFAVSPLDPIQLILCAFTLLICASSDSLRRRARASSVSDALVFEPKTLSSGDRAPHSMTALVVE